eukprot:357733-Chlamydomonas_euryale.AAC.5
MRRARSANAAATAATTAAADVLAGTEIICGAVAHGVCCAEHPAADWRSLMWALSESLNMPTLPHCVPELRRLGLQHAR